MNQRVITSGEELILKVGVRTKSSEQIRIVVSDANQKNTVFTNRYNIVNGDQRFYVRMPLSPLVALVQVFNDKDGSNAGFVMIDSNGKPGMGIERLPLEKKMDIVDMGNPDVREFVDLAQRFCYNAGWLAAGNYQSGKIKFSYLPTIINEELDKESATPARIGEDSAIIEISQKLYVPYTVPMRFAILCHEFSHCYRNEDKYSEVEADLQGLLIYLGLGYPHIEAYQAFLETFIGTPTELNNVRYQKIKKFITDFEQHKFLLYE